MKGLLEYTAPQTVSMKRAPSPLVVGLQSKTVPLRLTTSPQLLNSLRR
jgi:hypothetical protein